MIVEQNPGTPGNSTENVSAGADTLTSVIDALGGSTEPKNEPASNGGDKDEGTKEKAQEQAENPKWMSQLDGDSLKDEALVKQLSKFQKLGDLAKGYANLEKKLGNSVNIPGEDATDEERKAFYQKLGVPESAEGYSIKDEKAANFLSLAYNNNLTDSQAKAIYDGLAQIGAEAAKASAEQIKAMAMNTDKVLKEEWGQEYSKNLEYLKRGIADYGGNTLGAKLKASGLLYDADIVKMFASLGRANAESVATTKGAGGNSNDYKSTADGGHFDFGL